MLNHWNEASMCHSWRLAPDPFSCVLTVCPADGRAVWCQLWAQRCWLGSAVFGSVDIWSRRGALNMGYWYCTDRLAPRCLFEPVVVVWFSTYWNKLHGLVVHDVIAAVFPPTGNGGGSRQEADAGGGASDGGHPDRALPGLFPGFGHLQHSAGFVRDGPKTEGESEPRGLGTCSKTALMSKHLHLCI